MTDRHIDEHRIRLRNACFIGERGGPATDQDLVTGLFKERLEPTSHQPCATDQAYGMQTRLVEHSPWIGAKDSDFDAISRQSLLHRRQAASHSHIFSMSLDLDIKPK